MQLAVKRWRSRVEHLDHIPIVDQEIGSFCRPYLKEVMSELPSPTGADANLPRGEYGSV